jgi:tRNA 5-methylaminomethyl-2-thiouridine biosynthesis bifunctional protein
MWQASLLQLVARTCGPETTLASYSVASDFRKALQQAGFSFQKLPGFSGKRHMLQATCSDMPRPAVAADTGTRGTVCVAGGGLAGCSTAYALAEAGWQVILLEQAGSLASGGSGNLQGILHCKPATADTLDNHFNLHAYLFAQRHYSALRDYQGLPWHQCGMLHVGFNAEQQKRFDRVLATGRYSAAILRRLEPDAASAVAGINISAPCLYFPRSGWLNPGVLCQLYSQHPRITVHTGQKAQELHRETECWQVTAISATDTTTFKVDAVVLCNGADAYDFPQCRALPIISNRGQVDVYASTADTNVNTILCGQGYVLPSSNGMQSIGGSYYVEATSVEKNQRLHIDLLRRMQPELAASFAAQTPLQYRVAQRCQTPDRMPLVGKVDAQGSPGLYINVGHGSNGLARTPLSAAWLTSLLCGTPPPLEGKLARLLDPQRFAKSQAVPALL